MARFNRAQKRAQLQCIDANIEGNTSENGETLLSTERNLTYTCTCTCTCLQPANVDASVQCSLDCENDNLIPVLFCALTKFETKHEAGTQAVIPKFNAPHTEKETYPAREMKNVKVGVNQEMIPCDGFHGYRSIRTEEEMKDLTGVSLAVFTLLLNFLSHNNHFKLNNENRLLIFLMKFKLGLTFSALATLFCVNRSAVTRIFQNLLNVLCKATENFIFWPSRDAIVAAMPVSFKEHYSKCVTIIDCTEIRVETPPTVQQKALMYSNYKGAYSVKFLLAVAPNGLIIFISKCYGGRATDGFITLDSEVLSYVRAGDIVLAEKGFPEIKTCQENKKSILVMTPFLTGGQFTASEANETYQVASVSVHVERSIQRIKVYDILSKITVELLPCIDSIVHICCVLANLQPPIIKMPHKQ